MRLRILALLALMAAPLAAADGPAAVLQTASPGKLLEDVRAAVNIVAGDIGTKGMDDALKQALGEQGFQGLDLTKPVLGYVIFHEKDPDKTSFILLVGIKGEEDFIALLRRAQLEPEADKDVKGLYKLGHFDLPQPDEKVGFDVLMRVSGGTAYIGFNVKAEELDPAKAFKAEQLHDPKETALIAFRQFNERIPPDVLKNNMKNLDELVGKLKKEGGLGPQEAVILTAAEKLVQSMVKMSLDSKETGSRLTLDKESGELAIDTYYMPKPGTEFAKSLAARKPTENAFAGLIGNSTAAGGFLQMPVGMKEMQDLMVSGLDLLQEKVKEDPPPPFAKDLVDELIKGAIRTVKSGSLDFAIAVNGPDKDGHFVAVGALQFEDARPIEKAIKANLNDFPAEVRDVLKVDVDKIGDINVHSIEPPERGEPPGYSRTFGDRKIYVACGPKGIYGALGNGAMDSLKSAINGKPGRANAFDILVNPKRLGQLITAFDAEVGGHAEKIMGNEDKTHSAYTLSISGGDSLRIKFSLNLKILPRFIAQYFMLAFGG